MIDGKEQTTWAKERVEFELIKAHEHYGTKQERREEELEEKSLRTNKKKEKERSAVREREGRGIEIEKGS